MHNIRPIEEILDSTLAEIEARSETPEMPTGIKPVDDQISSLRRKELTVIGARPGEGKSSFALNIAWNLVSKGKKVCFLSLEMCAEMIIERILCLDSGIPNTTFWRGTPPKEKEKFLILKETLRNSSFMLLDNIGFTFESLEQLILKDLSPTPDVIFIDYVQMISKRGYSGRGEAVSEYTRACYELCKKANTCIVLMSQLRRPETKSLAALPTSDELKWSGSLEENADCVILLHWPYKKNREEPINKYNVIVDKNRRGPINWGEVHFQPEVYRFSEKPHELVTDYRPNKII